MLYITFATGQTSDGWFDQAKLRLAPASATAGSVAVAVVGGGGGKKRKRTESDEQVEPGERLGLAR